MEVRKFQAGRKYRKTNNDINMSPRFDYNFYKRTPKYNSRVLIGNWYEETNVPRNHQRHRQTEYQRQFSTKVIPQFKKLAEANGIKQFRNNDTIPQNKYTDDTYLSTYDISYQCTPYLQENYSKSDITLENAKSADYGDESYAEAGILQSETNHLEEDFCE